MTRARRITDRIAWIWIENTSPIGGGHFSLLSAVIAGAVMGTAVLSMGWVL